MDSLLEKRSYYPRVSEIIGKQTENEFRQIPMDTLANACLRGQKVHDYCTAWVNNLWICDIEPEYDPYYQSFINWYQENVEEPCHTAVRLYDDEQKFTGEFDMIVKLKSGKLALIDIKTSCTKSRSWPIQLSAYGHLCRVNGYKFDTIMNVHLKKTAPAQFEEINGEKVMISPPQVKCIPIEYTNISWYWEIFSSALICYDHFARKEVKQCSN